MKRALDIVISSLLLVVLSPVLLIAAIVVAVSIGRPIFFHQERAGLHGQPFTIVKLRTMAQDRDEDGELLPDAERLTRVGRFLRSSSVDELPELWNVIRGDMSLVGPRPLPVKYVERYSWEQARRLAVRPGITGWAQINGRNLTTWESRLGMDVWYVENRNLLMDLTILFRTVTTVFRRNGVSADGHATMPEFLG